MDVNNSIILERSGRICTLYLNKPNTRNALDFHMREELSEALDSIATDPSIRVLILSGKGSAFCAGGDLRSMDHKFNPFEGRQRLKTTQHTWLKKLIELEIPVIAAVNGVAAGAGFNLAIACDLVVAAEEAKFIQSFIKVGLVPDAGGLYYLPRLVGLHKAKELMFSGGIIEAREAERLGIVNTVVPGNELMAYAQEKAAELSQLPMNALALIKKMLNLSLESNLDTMLELEAMAQDLCFASEDFVEGRKAFFDKRKPKFKNN
ncbi:enoyl-CoA hydratase/isomerase family protein [Paradesulfitobacterium ferrireducens]|uniref:enoyl-CoA hydratase/isomerase family protein n=1 Tax=Paradesulfitobacterium ferrireducens TaxID=2816476 RepID=UPI001A8D1090|nr:enoyl-CoA hydratase-related protein [Paradesulfitobacterium ferrireducens]